MDSKPSLRVIVCGGRDYEHRTHVYMWLDRLFAPYYPNDVEGKAGTWLPRPDLVIITGGAKGVDSFAEDWAVVNWVKHERYDADWKELGRGAGPKRNQRMIDEGKPDMVLAFPGGLGTADMVMKASIAKIPVMKIPK